MARAFGATLLSTPNFSGVRKFQIIVLGNSNRPPDEVLLNVGSSWRVTISRHLLEIHGSRVDPGQGR